MKILPSLVVIFLVAILFSCNSSKLTGTKTVAGNEWLIRINTVERLEKNYVECIHPEKCMMPDIFNTNDSQYNYLIKHFNNPQLSEVFVRYGHKDEYVYRKLFGFDKGSGEGAVNSYITKILKVSFTADEKTLAGLDKEYYIVDNKNNVTAYSFYVRICPPPKPCNGAINPPPSHIPPQ